ncbi:extracellular calcium-sensing receptor-like [Xenopus tropicalis]|uniref:Extracellular calcium-sensing receptor-like n=1 Tax=Xenopus tropicalis TaxID=8364 RepID=A0A8J1JWX0_XENTR|nr:extracellular calcium-sensing receptor-like [Xenopus tropicalis]
MPLSEFSCWSAIATAESVCKLPLDNLQVYEKDGNILMGGLVPVHLRPDNINVNFTKKPDSAKCDKFYTLRYQEVLAMVYAINEINNDTSLLPNVTLGFRIYDSCYKESKAMEGSMRILSGIQKATPNYRCESNFKIAGIIGDLQSSSSLAMARILGLYRFPQIAYASALSDLRDKIQFPSFLRTLQSDQLAPIYIINLMLHFGWTWIGLLVSDNDFGLYSSELVRKQIEAAGICVAFFMKLSAQHTRYQTLSILQAIRKSSANVVYFYCSMPEVIPFIRVATEQKTSGKVWVAHASWISSPIFSYKEFWKTLNGTIGFIFPFIRIPGFGNFLYSIHPSLYPEDIFIKSFWETSFGCLWSNQSQNQSANTSLPYCTGEENLKTLAQKGYNEESVRYAILIYNAVYSLAHGINDMISGESSSSGFNITQLQPWKLLHYLRKVHFNNTAGQKLYFDINGEQPSIADFVNWQALPDGTTKYVRLINGMQGSQWDEASKNINIFWSGGFTEVPLSICSERCPPGYRKAPRKGQPVCCFDCISCSDNEFSNETDSIVCTNCPEWMWPTEQHDGCRPRSLEYLAYEDPLGGTLASLSVVGSLIPLSILGIFLRNSKTPVVKANNRNLSYLLLFALFLCFLCSLMFIGAPVHLICVLRQITFGVSFVLCVSCVLGKTIMVVIAFNATQPKSSRRMWLNSRIPNTLIIVCMTIQLIICSVWVMHSPSFKNNDITSKLGVTILECVEGSPVAFWCMMGYMGFLATLCFVVAYFSRNLPGSFNEAKMITFSMLIFGAVWISFIPTYLSTRGKESVAVEIFAILCSCSGLLALLFFPKCYIIILRPEMNNKEFLTGKRGFKHSKVK